MIDKYAKVAFETFFFNKKAYAIQEKVNEEVNFFTKHKRIDANKLEYYVRNKKAILSYQQKYDKLKWLCLDFDISKQSIGNDFNFLKDEKSQMLLSEVKLVIDYLTKVGINYLIEYSGNRGIHIWIVMSTEISKNIGYQIIQKIMDNVNFSYILKKEDIINLDLFPTVATSNGNTVGKGVKIPLSYHLKSNSYSYLIESIDEKLVAVEELDDEFVSRQTEILEKYEKNNTKEIIEKLDIKNYNKVENFHRISGNLNKKTTLDSIIDQLSKSEFFKYIFGMEISILNEEYRKIIVATLIRLTSDDDKNLGKKLVKEFFQRSDNYDEVITESKIKMLSNLYPPSIEFMERTLKITCNYCKQNNIKNVTELLDGFTFTKNDEFDSIIDWAIRSEIEYLQSNDEVPLNFVQDELYSLDKNDLKKDIHKILENNNLEILKPEYYKFSRKESEIKTRILYGMSARDRVLSTVIMKYVSDVIGQEITTSLSYSYRINNNFSNQIFIDWNKSWLEYAKDVRECAEHGAYDNYYLIKIDIRSFYDNINLRYLQEILTSQNTYDDLYSSCKISLDKLDSDAERKYFNAINYLMYLCRELNDKGVPQGPAFARFLAEVYLTPLDRFIRGKIDEAFDFACRYVDDYFIIVRDYERAQELANGLDSMINRIMLQKNDEKCKVGILSEFKTEIIQSDDIEKYAIDSVDNNTPIYVKHKIEQLVFEMVDDTINTNNVKNIPFILTHLIDDNIKDMVKNQIINFIKSTDIGRGSMFKHFYRKLAFPNTDISEFANVCGLSKTNLINEIQRNYVKLPEQCKDLLVKFVNGECKEYERTELIRTILINGIDINDINIKDTDWKHIIKLIKITKNIKWTDKFLNITLSQIQNLTNKAEAITLVHKILFNSSDIPKINDIVDVIYSIFDNSADFIIENVSFQIIFDLIAFITFHIKEYDMTKAMWKMTIDAFERQRVKEYNASQWYKFEGLINSNELHIKNLTMFISNVLNDNSCVEKKMPHSIEKEFCLNALVFATGKDMKSLTEDRDLKDKILKIAKDHNLEFINWCYDEDVTFHPSEEFAMKNLEKNNRLVLMKGNEILIRGDKHIFKESDNVDVEKWNLSTESYFSKIEIKNELLDFNSIINEKNLFEILISIYSLYKNMEENSPINIFESGSITRDNKLFLDYSKMDETFIVYQGAKLAQIKPNINSVMKEMISQLKESNIEPYTLDPNVILQNKSFLDEIIPETKYKLNEEGKINYYILFLKNFYKYYAAYGSFPADIYSIEEMIIKTIVQFIDNEKSNDSNAIKDLKSVYKLLNLYNSLKYSNKDRYLLYKKVEVKDLNLAELIDTLDASISQNLNINICNKIVKELRSDFNRILEILNIDTLSVFTKEEAKINRISKSIKIGDNEFDIKDIKVYEIGMMEDFEELTERKAILIESCYIYENNVVLIPNFLKRSVEIISEKSDKLDSNKQSELIKIMNIPKYKDAINVMCNQNNNGKEENENILNMLCLKIDHCYRKHVIEIISKYRYLSQDEMEEFINKAKKYINDSKCIVIPLKNYVADQNGLEQILTRNKFTTDFERGTEHHSALHTNITNFIQGKVSEKIVFLSDIGLSGSQVRTTFDYYQKGNFIHKDKINNPFYGYTYDILIKNLAKAKEIIFLNCIYTPIYENDVRKTLAKHGISTAINFDGTLFSDYKSYLFNSIHEKTIEKFDELMHTDKFKAILRKKVVDETYDEYLKNAKLDDIKNLLIVRYNSMPKKHHIFFSNENVFKYRKDPKVK
ncbi:reverse transcriptase domain-containing protein [Clostridium beijerinckii]|uniref:reverse transcriptase domain-containing protein n=1 Tax=Clostridium beijerinckii TaxID=1520 RepID=UPI0022266164|nr:reverse transcriptase domain-containing protein [Clostridium beijerinckii]UYZ36042.1 reverse transcriptase domain-containing protein [Clostridium beijerinckii]